MQRRCASSPRQSAQRRAFLPASVALLLAVFALSGCQHYYRPPVRLPPMTGLQPPTPLETVQAMVTPPLGWKAEPLKLSDRHIHQVWLSPSGDTAFGVIRFRLPFPVGSGLVMRKFLEEMRRLEQRAIVLSREYDEDLPGLRFTAEGATHTVRVNLITHGFRGWAIYAGTYTNKVPNLAELELAERAREATAPGLPSDYKPAGEPPTASAKATP